MVVLLPAPGAVPERRPSVIAAGNPSLKKMTKTEAGLFYRSMVSGYVLATVKEAFAVAPGLSSVRIVAVRHAGADSYGQLRVEAILAARIMRSALQGVRWDQTDANQVLVDVSAELAARLQGPTRAPRRHR